MIIRLVRLICHAPKMVSREANEGVWPLHCFGWLQAAEADVRGACSKVPDATASRASEEARYFRKCAVIPQQRACT
jgi:hypothetical protein